MSERIGLVSQEEYEEAMTKYSSSMPSHVSSFVDGQFNFILNKAIDVDSDPEGISWRATEVGLGLHSWIELIIGEKRKAKVCLPICLVNSEARRIAYVLLRTSIDPDDGKLNSKKAEFNVYWPPQGEKLRQGSHQVLDGIKVRMSLPFATMQYLIMLMVPEDFMTRFVSKHCIFCRQFLRRDLKEI